MKKIVIVFTVLLASMFCLLDSGYKVYGQASVDPSGDPCWTCIKVKNGSQVRYCGTCTWIDNSTDCLISFESQCTPAK